MRRRAVAGSGLISLAVGLACSGGISTSTSAPAPLPPPVRTEEPPPPGPEAGLAGRYLVIIASKLELDEAEAALDQLRERWPAAQGGLANSSRLKNLMPCYWLAFAGSYQDKAEAQKVVAHLQSLGLEGYVKAAGAYVPPAPALDRVCDARRAPDASAELVVVQTGAGRGFVPWEGQVRDPRPPEGLGDRGRTWWSPAGPAPDLVYQVVGVTSRRPWSCPTLEAGLLTQGTPHFGFLLAMEGPACGSPTPALRLDCELPEGELFLAQRGEGSPLRSLGPGTPAPELVSEATALLERDPNWRSEEGEGPTVRTVEVLRFGRSPLRVVQGTVTDQGGVCMGFEATYRALFSGDGPGLGRPLGPFHRAEFSSFHGLIERGEGGRPAMILSRFPEQVLLVEPDGSDEVLLDVAYCDCAC